MKIDVIFHSIVDERKRIYWELFRTKNPKTPDFRWWNKISNLNYGDFVTLFWFYFPKIVSFPLRLWKQRWKSSNRRNLASFPTKLAISADNFIFTWNSRFPTKSQRKGAYFRQINLKIVCHDPQILSIFLVFRFAVISRENRPVKVGGQNMRRKWRIPGWCALKSQLFHSAFARNLFRNDYSIIFNEL